MRELIAEPGIYDIPEAEYHADPCQEPSLSASISKTLLAQSPRHAWVKHPRLNPGQEEMHRKDFDIGSAAHSMLLEGKEPFVIIDADSYRTKDAKAQRDAAYEAGKIPLLTAQVADVRAMATAATAQLKGHEEAFDAFATGRPEQTLIWREGPSWCRARLDWLPDKGTVIWDYKSTTDANPEVWQRRLFDLGADVQAGFYRRGVKALLRTADPQFRFIVQEVSPPYALSVVALSPSAQALGDMKAARAIETWQWCVKHNRWPGYPKHTCFVDAPPWNEIRFEEAKARDEFAACTGNNIQELANEWQAPLEREAS